MLHWVRIHRFIRKVMLFQLRALVACIIAGLFLLYPVAGGTAEQESPVPQKTTAPAAAPAPAAPSVIAVADVATKATEVENLLQTLTQNLAPSPHTEIIRKLLPVVSRQIEQDLTATLDILREQPALPTLQAQQQQWQQMQLKITDWLTVLTKRSDALQEGLDLLTGVQKTWEVTLKAAEASKAPGPLLEQINGTLASIRAAQTTLQFQLTSVLDLQSSVSGEVEKCGNVLAKIAQVQQKAMSGILTRDSRPITSPEFWGAALTELPQRAGSIAAAHMMDLRKYFEEPLQHMPLPAGLFVILALLFLAGRRQVRKWTAAGEAFSSDISVFNHPVAAALGVELLVATSPFFMMPTVVRYLLWVLSFAPIIVFIRPVVSAFLIPALYVLWIFGAIEVMREAFSADVIIGQVVLVLESLAGIVAMVWFARKLKPVYGEAAEPSRPRVLHSAPFVFLLVFAAGLVAAATGYLRLARLMTPGLIAGGILALGMYAALRIFIGVVAFAFHAWPLRTLSMIMHNRDPIERRLYRFLIWAAIVTWITRYLSQIGFLEPAISFGRAVLTAKFERGPISISPCDVLEFFLTIWAAYLLSAFIRFVLQEDVYPRMKVEKGKSYAVSSLLHYFILTIGFTIAIAALGVNLTKLTVLTGAFGVGIGFGLQSVVNNFVSGLILLFERPIHVGDVVEVGDLLGKVLRIGIRASTVHTRQGSDIVVPNSQLVTEKVTNWTLSDRLRRVDLPVGVNYSAPPKEVIKILETVAQANPDILRKPAPQGLFMGFGDSSINFELRAWTDQFDDWPRVRSELASAIYDAIYAAGMTFPFPQREVRVLRDSVGGATAARGNPVDKT